MLNLSLIETQIDTDYGSGLLVSAVVYICIIILRKAIFCGMIGFVNKNKVGLFTFLFKDQQTNIF